MICVVALLQDIVTILEYLKHYLGNAIYLLLYLSKNSAAIICARTAGTMIMLIYHNRSNSSICNSPHGSRIIKLF